MRNFLYKFYVNGEEIHPIYKDDLAKDIALESGQVFTREKLSGKLTLMGEDFIRIIREDIETEFILTIYKQIYGQQPKLYFTGRFFKTDCSINYDRKSLEVTVDPYDDYDQVLEILDKEIDIIQAAPAITELTAVKRPVIQIYLPGSKILDNFLGGNHWTSEVENPTSDQKKLENDYKFTLNSNQREFDIEMTSSSNYKQFNGHYKGDLSRNEYYNANNSDTRLAYVYSSTSLSGKYLMLQLKDSSGKWVNKYRCGSQGNDPANKNGAQFYPDQTGQPGNNDIKGNGFLRNPVKGMVYVRYMLNVDRMNDINTMPIPTNDIVPNNLNYTRVVGLDVSSSIIVFTDLVDTPTPWGKASSGKYYAQPPSWWYGKVYPLSRDSWNYASYWFTFPELNDLLDAKGSSEFKVPGAFYLMDAIDVIIKKLAPGIKFTKDFRSSHFFYTRNRVNSFSQRLILTQKSNVLHGDKAVAATKGVTSLGAILRMLKDLLQVHWSIDNGYLRLEHIEYYRNGGSYGYVKETPDIDLTKLINTKVKEPYSTGTNNIEFDKIDMPQSYVMEFMDDVSDVFKGLPLVMRSNFINKGRIENISIAGFNVDIDYVLANVDKTSPDGFMIFSVDGKPINIPVNRFKDRYLTKFSTGNPVTEIAASGWEYVEVDGGVMSINFSANSKGYVRIVNTLNGVALNDNIRPVEDIRLNLPPTAIADKRYILYKTSPTAENFDETDSSILVGSVLSIERFRDPAESKVKLSHIELDGVTYTAQNAYMSWPYIAQNYWAYDLSSENAYMGESQLVVFGTKRKRKQTVTVPLEDDPKENALVKTAYGTGQLEKTSINLNSRLAKMTLKFDLYD